MFRHYNNYCTVNDLPTFQPKYWRVMDLRRTNLLNIKSNLFCKNEQLLQSLITVVKRLSLINFNAMRKINNVIFIL